MLGMNKRKLKTKRSVADPAPRKVSGEQSSWTFLSNHSHVIICLARDPEIRMRDIASAVGITERAVIRIVMELEEAGYVRKEKVGRRNRYTIVADKHFRHPLEAHHSIKGILALARE
jgi:DNA-binding MarR family transcriptional regulator